MSGNADAEMTFNGYGKLKGRLAPSPSGRMHAGNIFAALMSWLIVKSTGGTMVLRIEDLDIERSKPEYADQVQRDFEMLGITWDEGPYYQSTRDEAYRAAFDTLTRRARVYPCFCTRADLRSASAPHRGEKNVYSGTCKNLSESERALKARSRKPAMRIEVPDEDFLIDDLIQGPYRQNLARDCGDYIIRRSDGLFAYQLAVVVDDAEQGVNCVVRGVDLLPSSPQQRFMQEALGFEPCVYAHVPLLVAEKGRRLSKRDHDAGLQELLSAYKTPEAVLGHIAGITGITSSEKPVSCEELLSVFERRNLAHMFEDNVQVLWE